MTVRPGLRQMWIGTVLNCAVGILQMVRYDDAVIHGIVVVGITLGVLGGILASRASIESGRWLVFASAVVFIPIGVVAALGVQRLRDDRVRNDRSRSDGPRSCASG